MIILRQRRRPSSFTLIEMLTVIAIIAILAGMILWAATAAMAAGARNRAITEIKGLGQALDNYKVDNGGYPSFDMGAASNYSSSFLDPSVAGGSYQLSSETLYQGLSGQTNFTDTPVGNKSYYPFRSSQVGNPSGNGTSTTYVQDPFDFSYGYNTGNSTNHPPYGGFGWYDLWSTGGSTTNYNTWISNWNH